MTPLKLTIAAVSAGYDDGKQVGVATLTCDLDTIRAVGGMLLREVVVQLADDADPYRAFAVKLAEYVAPPDAADMVARHFAPGDLGTLSEHITERIDTASRLERLQRLTAWTSLPEIPEHFKAVEVKIRTPHGEDERTFGWRDDDGEWHCLGSDGNVPITDADVVGWRRIIP